MQMYVNYYDRYEKQEDENPTIGVLLCQDKDDSLVELTLPKDSNIYASKYQLYLPDKKVLQDKLREWTEGKRVCVLSENIRKNSYNCVHTKTNGGPSNADKGHA